MNKFALTVATVCSISCFSASSMSPLPAGAVALNHNYAWTIEIDTQELPQQFQYRGSNISQVVKTQLYFYSQTNQSSKTAYEDLWYSNAKSLGMERHNKLGINPGDAIAITVLHKSTGTAPVDEQRAAGKAIVKAVVDANINKNMVATIKVPMASFQTITSELQNYNFTPVPTDNSETSVESDINLFMESVPPGLTQGFVHYH